MANLDHAVRAYRESLAAAETAKREAEQRVKASREQIATRRTELAAAIVEAARDGVRQIDIIRATGYSRERVRSILRAGGIEAE